MLTDYVVIIARQIPGTTFQYYLMEMPKDQLVETGSSVIVSNNLYTDVDWEIFRYHMLETSLFCQLMQETTKKYVNASGKYLECADKIVSYTGSL